MKFQKWIQDHSNHITWITAALIVVGFVGKFAGVMLLYKLALVLASIIAVIPIAIHAFQALKAKVISIELLVTIAVVGAFIIGEYNESAIVTFLFLFGNFLEQKTLSKTRESIKSLTEMAPTTALIVQADGTTEEVEIDDVEEGDIVLVKTGGAIPVDGVVVEGKGYADEAAVTGESKEVTKQLSDEVFQELF